MQKNIKNKKKNYLITGGLGFIGSAITNRLLEKGFNVTVFDDLSRGKKKRIFNKNKKINIINGDIRNLHKLKKSLKNIDAVIHLAYVNGTKYFYTRPTEILEIAVKGIMNIIDACKEKKIKELYLASSSEVYQTPTKIPTDEKESLKIPDIYNPRYSYGGGKILTELMGIHYGKKYFKKLIIFRPHNVYGPDMGNEHVMPEFINRFKKLKEKQFKIQGSGNEIRSFIYIDDFVNAFELIMKKGKHLQIYNIGTTDKITIKRLVLKISKILKKKIIIKKSPLRKGGTKKRLPDITKLRKIGFKQKVKIEQGLKKLIDYYF
jgi:nucleoside-diphosphate-sugar epimerase